jgi:hypothetical protein
MGFLSWLFGESESSSVVLDSDGNVIGTVIDGSEGDKWVKWETLDGTRMSSKASNLKIHWTAEDCYNRDQQVPDYHYSQLRTNPKYDDRNRPRNVSADDWNDFVKREVKEAIKHDYAVKEAAAKNAQFANALWYVDHPSEQKHIDAGDRPPKEMIEVATKYRSRG